MSSTCKMAIPTRAFLIVVLTAQAQAVVLAHPECLHSCSPHFIATGSALLPEMADIQYQHHSLLSLTSTRTSASAFGGIAVLNSIISTTSRLKLLKKHFSQDVSGLNSLAMVPIDISLCSLVVNSSVNSFVCSITK